jgi:hypothetical protein
MNQSGGMALIRLANPDRPRFWFGEVTKISNFRLYSTDSFAKSRKCYGIILAVELEFIYFPTCNPPGNQDWPWLSLQSSAMAPENSW